MGARFRSWWQIIRKLLAVVGIIVACALGTALIVGIIGGYLFNWNWTGLRQKTLWDWMQLLFVPVVLAVAGFWFNHRERKAAELRADNERKAAELRADNERKAAEFGAEAEREIEQQRAKTERDIAEDNQREAALQAYINEMSELLLHENLRESKEEDEVRKIARVRTITVLPRLDGKRKGRVLQFLHESGLIEKGNSIVDLEGADLTKANLMNVNLTKADLSEANLCGAFMNRANMNLTDLTSSNLRGARLSGAILIRADLTGADIRMSFLDNAILSQANLFGLPVADELLTKAKSLQGATMPDGSIHP
jgi:hypothetical protein